MTSRKLILLTLLLLPPLPAAPPTTGESPAEHLPPHITQVTWFGERADWSHDGKKILFLIEDLRRRDGDRPRDQSASAI